MNETINLTGFNLTVSIDKTIYKLDSHKETNFICKMRLS